MHGFKPNHKRAPAAQNLAGGGMVSGLKSMLGFKPEDPERAKRIAEYRASQERAKQEAAAAKPEQPKAVSEYAGNSALKRREKEAGLEFKDGGPIRGPGTGTSDSIKDKVRAGTYIMPADSTKAVGHDALAGLGSQKMPVRLSNGEYELPPEQVHAVGVQALDQLKDATHAGAKGFNPGAYFAGGGQVRDPNRPDIPVVGTRGPVMGGGGGGLGREAVAAAMPQPQAVQQKFGVGALPANPVTNPGAIVADRERKAQGFALGGEVTNDVMKIGNSYSGGNVGGSITINGAAPQGAVSTVPGAPGAPNAAVQALPAAQPIAAAPAVPAPVAPVAPMAAAPALPAAAPPVNSFTARNNAVSGKSITNNGGRFDTTPAVPGAVPGAAPVNPAIAPRQPTVGLGTFDPMNPQKFADGGAVGGFNPQRLYGGGGVLTEEQKRQLAAGTVPFGSRGLDQLREMIPKVQDMGYPQAPVLAQPLAPPKPAPVAAVGAAVAPQVDQATDALQRARAAQPAGSANTAAIDQAIAARSASMNSVVPRAAKGFVSLFQKPQAAQAVAPAVAAPVSAGARVPDTLTDVQRRGALAAAPADVAIEAQQAVQSALLATPPVAAAQAVAQGAAPVELAPVEAKGFFAPTVRHSGNDWQARNDLRNARVSASSITNRPEWQGAGMGRFRGGQQQGDSASAMAYKAALAQDAALRGEEVRTGQQAMALNQGAQVDATRQNAENNRTVLREQGAQTRDTRKAGIDERTLAMQEQAAGFATRAAAQSEQLRNVLFDPKATPEQRKTAQEQLLALNNKTESAKDRYITTGGGSAPSADGMSMVPQPQRIFDTQTRQYVDQPAQGASALPPGMVKQVGTSGGKPVYEDASGKRFTG